MGNDDLDEKLTEIARSVLWGEDDFRGRLTEELNQLHERLNKLEIFMNTAQFDSLSDIERSALREQYGHMRAYYNVLSGRVSRLCGTP